MKSSFSFILAFAGTSALGVIGCTASADPSAVGATTDSLEEGHRWKVLDARWEAQSTGYWCGPTATRIALSARTTPPSQQELARQLGTTTNGTDTIDQVTRVLNANLGAGTYESKLMPHDPPTLDEKNRFWDDIVQSIDANYPVVANIVAPPNNHPPGYPTNRTIYHYFTIIGYNPDTGEAYVADPANFGGNSKYWLRFDQLATLVPPKGYSALPTGTRCAGGTGSARGAIGVRYRALGGCRSVLGVPKTEELGTPDRLGRYNVFDRGSIYWTKETGAHEVLGVIRDKYAAAGWEAGALGYPTSGEYDVPGGRKSDFQHGSITWNAATNVATVSTAR